MRLAVALERRRRAARTARPAPRPRSTPRSRPACGRPGRARSARGTRHRLVADAGLRPSRARRSAWVWRDAEPADVADPSPERGGEHRRWPGRGRGRRRRPGRPPPARPPRPAPRRCVVTTRPGQPSSCTCATRASLKAEAPTTTSCGTGCQASTISSASSSRARLEVVARPGEQRSGGGAGQVVELGGAERARRRLGRGGGRWRRPVPVDGRGQRRGPAVGQGVPQRDAGRRPAAGPARGRTRRR